MNLGLSGKRFVVADDGRGLGRAVAAQLITEGARVLLVARDADAVARAAAELGDAAFGLAADLSTQDGVDDVSTSAAITLGGVDGVLVDASSPPPGGALELDDAEWQRAFDLLIAGPLRLLRSLVPQMDAGGSILVVTTRPMPQPPRGSATSYTLQPGVAALVKVLAIELAPAIRVNAVAPGRIDSDLSSLDEHAASEAGIPVDERAAQAAAAIPLGRCGDPAELGRVAAFLLSPAASYVTGTTVHVDGGAVVAAP